MKRPKSDYFELLPLLVLVLLLVLADAAQQRTQADALWRTRDNVLNLEPPRILLR
ncbi:MAG: hypothetical protein NW208_02725 [Bryobacter sp.]|nr:hypothetical protein [Bryobacter sp.]